MERYAAARSPRSDLPTKITATGGSTDTILEDTVNAFSTGDDSAFDGNWWAYITTDAGGSNAAPEGEFGRIASFDYSAGQWTLGSTLTAAIAAGDTAVLLQDHPDDIIESINDVQRSVYLPRYMPLSLTSDPNMDDSGTGGYTDVSTPSTSAKVSTQAHILTGTQSYHVVTDGLSEGIQTESVIKGAGNVDSWGTGQFIASAIFLPTAGAIYILQLYDETNSEVAEQISWTASDLNRWVEAAWEPQAPANSGEVSLRLISSLSAGTFYVNSMSLLHSEVQTYKVPINDASHINRIVRFPRVNTEDSDMYIPLASKPEPWPELDTLRDYEGVQSHRVSIRRPQEPLWVEYMGTGSTLSATTDTSDVPLEIMVEGVQAFMWGKRAKRTRNRALRDEYQQNFIQSTRVFDQLLLDRGLGKPRVKSPAPRKVLV
jgi:hypothetical protein